ncbi:hypothetical protein AAVH_30352, partial [Aphelenchoides avenae]
MQPEITLEVLRYCDRTSLEGLQMHSRYLRDVVNRHACTLPLRYIYEVRICHCKAIILLVEDDRNEFKLGALFVVQQLEMIFHRVNNTFIYRLELSFLVQDLPLPYCLRANADDLQCTIRVLRIEAA